MTDWSNDMVLDFIQEYENEPCIWNPKDTNHKNRKRVNEAWTRISSIMNISVKELKNRKEIIMATFRRHLKKKTDSIQSSAEDDAQDIYKPLWFAYDSMESFLAPVYAEKNTSSSKETSQVIAEIEVEDGYDNILRPSTSLPSSTSVTSRRRRATEFVDVGVDRQMSSAFGQLTNILTKRENERPREEDDCELYSKLLAKKLRELPPDDRKLIMYDIDTLFINRIMKDKLVNKKE